MPITGDWWQKSSRPILKKQGGMTDADVEQGEIASCAVTSGTIAAGAVAATGQVADGIITSEKATSPLRTRVVVVQLPDPAKGAAFWTTCYQVWRPMERVELRQIRLQPLTCWSVTTCGMNLQIYSTAGAVATLTASTTELGSCGFAIALGTLTNTCLAADADLQIGAAAVNACDNIGLSALHIEYLTSG